MRAVIYARYSSDNQSAASIEDQVRQCRKFVAEQGGSIVEVYADQALSGASSFRPAYRKLLNDLGTGTFDVIVAEALDRLSRDLGDVADLHKHAAFHGISIITLAEGTITDLHVGLKGTMNALYLKDLAQKTRRGLEGRIRQGRSGGGLCYGYDVVRETDARGEPVHGGRTINEAEAAVVRRIFREFAAGRSPRTIARDLNAEGVPGPRGKYWRDTTIRGHRDRGTGIVNNELYLGTLVWNRRRYVKDPATGKRLARANPPGEWIIEDVPELRIVDDDLWNAVRDRQHEIDDRPAVRKMKESRFWEKRRARHLLTGLVTCGTCGATFTAAGKDYLACSAARKRGTCESTRGIRRQVLEDLILNALRRRLMSPDLVKEFVAEFHREANRHARDRESGRAAKMKELQTVTRRLDGLIDAIADGLRTPGLKGKLDELEARKAELEAELASPEPNLPRFHPNLAEVYADKVAKLGDALRDDGTRDEALNILRTLIDSVSVTPAADGGFDIDLTGAIAAMVDVALADPGAQNAKNRPRGAVIPEPFRSSVKVVAGTHNHLKLLVSTT